MIFFILANSAIIVPQNVKYCNYTDIDSCINDLGVKIKFNQNTCRGL